MFKPSLPIDAGVVEEEVVRVRMPRTKDGEILGIADQLLGASRVRVMCADGKSRLGRIPGKLKKRMWIREGVITTLDYPVSTGKEANVFHAIDGSGRGKALNIYRTATATFRNIAMYIEGDPRFKRVKRATKSTIFPLAQKEYNHLVRMG